MQGGLGKCVCARAHVRGSTRPRDARSEPSRVKPKSRAGCVAAACCAAMPAAMASPEIPQAALLRMKSE